VNADLPSAVEAALAEAGPDDLVLVSGSLFLVGETLVWWRRSSR
jgi:folylpolyglutamate synthase/dihydropteroate synthase